MPLGARSGDAIARAAPVSRVKASSLYLAPWMHLLLLLLLITAAIASTTYDYYDKEDHSYSYYS